MLVDKILFFVSHKMNSNDISTKKYINDEDKVMVDILDGDRVVAKFKLEEIYESCIEHGSHFFDHFVDKLKDHISNKLENIDQ